MTVVAPAGASTPIWFRNGWRQAHIFITRAQSDAKGNLTVYLTDTGTGMGQPLFSRWPVISLQAEDPDQDGVRAYGALLVRLSSDLKTLTAKTVRWYNPVSVSGSFETAAEVWVNIVAIGA